MSDNEAKMSGIAPENRWRYVRLDSAKVNIAARSGKPTWFRLVPVPIGNITHDYPAGDTIQVVEPWTPPETWADLPSNLLNQILDAIDEGMPDGNRYSHAPSAKERAAWKVIIRFTPSKTEAQAREIIRTWMKNDVLVSFMYEDPARRKQVAGLRVDHEKRPS
jgi:hypothetical protein